MARGCSVYVGNIDFDIPQEKIVEELSAIGKVVHFRLVYDRETGKSKGYGFCEYESPLIAETAVQKLKISFNGRPVKINYAESDLPAKPKEISQTQSLEIDKIVNVIESMDRDSLKEVIIYLKRMAIDQPNKLRSLLEGNVGLIVALLQCLITLNLIDSTAVYNLLKNSLEVNDQKAQVLERICQLTDEDVAMYPQDVKEKIMKVRGCLIKKGAKN
jgi:cleavage stimulation factor subunit 2